MAIFSKVHTPPNDTCRHIVMYTDKYESNSFQPLVLMSTPRAIKKSSEVSIRTLQRRSRHLRQQLNVTSSGDAATQSAALLKSFPKKERENILKEGNLVANHIGAEDLVALKSSLGIPWEKLKTVGR